MRDHHVVTSDGYTHYRIPTYGKSVGEFAGDSVASMREKGYSNREIAANLYRTGYNIKEIADLVKVKYNTAYAWKRRGYLDAMA